MQRIVLLSSLLWWELGTNSLITGPGEWLSFRRFTSNYPDPDPDPDQYWESILLPVTDNCPTWISGTEKMAIEIISWPNHCERYVAGPDDRTHNLLNTSRTSHPTDIVGLARCRLKIPSLGWLFCSCWGMPNRQVIPSDKIFNLHQAIIIDSFSCIFSVDKCI